MVIILDHVLFEPLVAGDVMTKPTFFKDYRQDADIL